MASQFAIFVHRSSIHVSLQQIDVLDEVERNVKIGALKVKTLL